MTKNINNGYSVVRPDGRQGQVGLNEKGIIIALSEGRVAGWLRELLQPCMKRFYTLNYASTVGEFDSLARGLTMEAAFVEIGFFEEAMIGCLERMRRLYPKLRVILFTVSGIQSEEAARYIYWCGGSFVSLRDKPEQIKKRLRVLLEGKEYIPKDLLLDVRDYERISGISPYLTHKEIEIVRCIAHEKTDMEMTYCLRVSISTLNNHLTNIFRKFRIRNRVGIVKLAVAKGILPERELRLSSLK
jgi:DNA-binding CsgD family transcriptional regulator